jgi:exodeoxyribonuclease V alpha subunit
MLQRNLIYTAITRAKKLCIFIGSKKALTLAINNDKSLIRFSGLKNRLITNLSPSDVPCSIQEVLKK